MLTLSQYPFPQIKGKKTSEPVGHGAGWESAHLPATASGKTGLGDTGGRRGQVPMGTPQPLCSVLVILGGSYEDPQQCFLARQKGGLSVQTKELCLVNFARCVLVTIRCFQGWRLWDFCVGPHWSLSGRSVSA